MTTPKYMRRVLASNDHNTLNSKIASNETMGWECEEIKVAHEYTNKDYSQTILREKTGEGRPIYVAIMKKEMEGSN